MIEGGKAIDRCPDLAEICRFAEAEKQTFWDEYRRLDNPQIYKVDLSETLYAIKNDLIAEIRKENV